MLISIDAIMHCNANNELFSVRFQGRIKLSVTLKIPQHTQNFLNSIATMPTMPFISSETYSPNN